MKKLLLALVILFLPLGAMAQGVVVSADPRATEAGREILRQGGSAADAAMAMMLALTVVEPQSSGIGGGGFLVHHDAKNRAIETIDGRETAPFAATPQRFLDKEGKPMPFLQAVQGGLSVGVPGNIRLMAMAHAAGASSTGRRCSSRRSGSPTKASQSRSRSPRRCGCWAPSGASASRRPPRSISTRMPSPFRWARSCATPISPSCCAASPTWGPRPFMRARMRRRSWARWLRSIPAG